VPGTVAFFVKIILAAKDLDNLFHVLLAADIALKIGYIQIVRTKNIVP